MAKLTVAFASLAFLLALSSAEARDRDQTIRCESVGDKHTYCPTNTMGEVEMVRQLSKTRCEQYDTWGADGDGSGVWVRNGCRAEFVVRERRGRGRRRDDREESA